MDIQVTTKSASVHTAIGKLWFGKAQLRATCTTVLNGAYDLMLVDGYPVDALYGAVNASAIAKFRRSL